MKPNLKEMEENLDKALANETSESLTKWITELRVKGLPSVFHKESNLQEKLNIKTATKEEIDSIRIKSYTYAF